MENTVLDSSSGSAPETSAVAQASHELSHKPFRAEVADLEQAADVIRDRLEPTPPNFVQKTLRIVTYPIALIAGAFYAHNEARTAREDFLKTHGYFDRKEDGTGMRYSLHENLKGSKTYEQKVILNRLHHREKFNIGARELGEEAINNLDTVSAEKPLGETAGFFKRLMTHVKVDYKSYNAYLSPDSKAKLIFQSVAAVSLALALGLTLSDNKNFLKFSGDKKSPSAADNKHATWQARHDAESSAAGAGSSIA